MWHIQRIAKQEQEKWKVELSIVSAVLLMFLEKDKKPNSGFHLFWRWHIFEHEWMGEFHHRYLHVMLWVDSSSSTTAVTFLFVVVRGNSYIYFSINCISSITSIFFDPPTLPQWPSRVIDFPDFSIFITKFLCIITIQFPRLLPFKLSQHCPDADQAPSERMRFNVDVHG